MITVGLRRFGVPVALIAVATTLVAVWPSSGAPKRADTATFGFSFQDIGNQIGATRDEIIADHLGIIGAMPNGNRAELSWLEPRIDRRGDCRGWRTDLIASTSGPLEGPNLAGFPSIVADGITCSDDGPLGGSSFVWGMTHASGTISFPQLIGTAAVGSGEHLADVPPPFFGPAELRPRTFVLRIAAGEAPPAEYRVVLQLVDGGRLIAAGHFRDIECPAGEV